MTSLSAFTPLPGIGRVRKFFWRFPEWWIFALCGGAWGAMLMHWRRHFGHGIHHWMSFAEELESWMLMVFAMMLPLVRDAVRTTAFGSLWSRRHRATVAFVVAYLTPWLAVGVAVAVLRGEVWAHNYAASALAFVVAAVWHLTPIHAIALMGCHRTMPLAPCGWRANRDCLRFGCSIGLACVASCWPLMLGCALSGHGIVAMTGGMILGLAERWSFRPRTGLVLLGALLLGSYYTVLAIMNHGG